MNTLKKKKKYRLWKIFLQQQIIYSEHLPAWSTIITWISTFLMISTFEMISSFSRLKNQIIIDIIYLSVLKADGNNYFLLETYHI